MLLKLNKVPVVKIRVLRNPGGGESPLILSFFRPKRENRRKKIRQKTRNLITLDYPERALLNLVNISESGLQFSAPKPLKKNQAFHFTINLIEEDARIEVVGRVVWSKLFSSSGDRLYRIGVSFLELSPEAGAVLRHFVYSSFNPA